MATTIKSTLAQVSGIGKPSIVELKPYLQPFPYARAVFETIVNRPQLISINLARDVKGTIL